MIVTSTDRPSRLNCPAVCLSDGDSVLHSNICLSFGPLTFNIGLPQRYRDSVPKAGRRSVLHKIVQNSTNPFTIPWTNYSARNTTLVTAKSLSHLGPIYRPSAVVQFTFAVPHRPFNPLTMTLNGFPATPWTVVLGLHTVHPCALRKSRAGLVR